MVRPSYKAIRSKIRELRRENAALERRNAELQARIAALEAALDAARREGKRQAAPFSKGPPQPHPKKPGRRSGLSYGRKGHRPAPDPSDIDEIYEATLPDACPDCGDHVLKTGVAQQYQTEIPRRPRYRQFNVHIGECVGCGRVVHGRHPLQTSGALGAASSQLGPDAQAAVVLLNKSAGLSHGKIVDVFSHLFGITLTRGGSAQIVLRAGRCAKPVYTQIANSIRGSPWAVPDETGWRIGGKKGWLHVLVGDQATCYQIDKCRSAEPAARILTWDYEGTLVHDGWAPYDRFSQAWHQQCVRHLQRRALELLETAVGGAVRFPRQVLALFREAFSLRDRFERGELSEDDLADGFLQLAIALEQLVARPRSNAANQTLANHLKAHLYEWFWFLLEPGLDATNYRAEQALRPAVVNRKVWGGNRTDAGARAQEILMSVIESCRRQQRQPIDFVHQILCGNNPRLITQQRAR